MLAPHQIEFFASQVTAGFGSGVLEEGALRQMELLRGLALALDKIQDLDLSGVHVMFGDDSGLDASGNVWLHSDGSVNEWARYGLLTL